VSASAPVTGPPGPSGHPHPPRAVSEHLGRQSRHGVLWLPVGPPASGKSELAARLLATGQIDEDAIVGITRLRQMFTGSLRNRGSDAAVFEFADRLTRERLRHGCAVYRDGTNLDAKRRDALVASLPPDTKIVTVVLNPPLAQLRATNAASPEPLPDDVLVRLHHVVNDLAWADLPGTVVPAFEVP